MTGTVHLAAQLARFEPLEEVERLVASAVAAIRNTYMGHVEAELLLVQAYAELRHGRRARACELIDSAASVGETSNLFGLRLLPHVLKSVFGFALREGIGCRPGSKPGLRTITSHRDRMPPSSGHGLSGCTCLAACAWFVAINFCSSSERLRRSRWSCWCCYRRRGQRD